MKARRRLIDVRLALGLGFVATLVAGSGALGATQPPTFARADYSLFGNNYVVGDFNGDRSLDLAGVGTAAKVRLNNGAGAFGAVVDYAIGGQGQDIAAGDFDGDGRLDLVVTINNPQIGLSLLKGNGDGTFSAPVTFPNTSGFDSPAVVAVDLDDDGRLDVVIAHQIACYTAPCVNTDLISVMLGQGDGTFQPSREIPVGRGMSEIAVGDYDRDGVKDLAIGGAQGQVYLLQGVGDGTFVQQPTVAAVVDPSFIPVTDIDAAELNGDAIQDLVVSVPHNGSRTAILIGNGDGTFRTPLVITSPQLNLPQQAAVADYNGDGFQDLALSLGDGSFGLLQIRNGNGDGTFQAAVHYLPPPPTSSVGGIFIASANLNADTKPDIVLNIGGAFPSFAVLLNSTGAAPPQTPSAPTLLSPAQDATPAQPVAFDWTDVTAATTYRIQVDDSSNFSAPLVVDRVVTPSQFTASTLNAGLRHWWRVRGINSAGSAGAWSSVGRFTPGAFTQTASLAGIALNPANVVGGTSSQGTVTLTSPAPAGGFAVALSSSNAAATVPAGVAVAQGATSAAFAIATSAVTASTPVTVTASAGGVSRTATLTVNPQQQTAILTVTATGRGGERVTSTPAGINVAVGSSGSAAFASGTAVTLSATNSRDVIWSGACSSGGNKTKTCSFTLNASASVTANVQ